MIVIKLCFDAQTVPSKKAKTLGSDTGGSETPGSLQ